MKHDPIKKGVTKCDTLLLIFERKFPCLRYGQICPKVPLFQLRQKCSGSANGQKCLIALLFALCSKKSVTGVQKRFPDLESKNTLTPIFTADKKVHHLQKLDQQPKSNLGRSFVLVALFGTAFSASLRSYLPYLFPLFVAAVNLGYKDTKQQLEAEQIRFLRFRAIEPRTEHEQRTWLEIRAQSIIIFASLPCWVVI